MASLSFLCDGEVLSTGYAELTGTQELENNRIKYTFVAEIELPILCRVNGIRFDGNWLRRVAPMKEMLLGAGVHKLTYFLSVEFPNTDIPVVIR